LYLLVLCGISCVQLLKLQADIKLIVEGVNLKMKDSPLDNPEEIRKIDKSNMLSFQIDAANHYSQALSIGEKVSWKNPKPENIIIAGMGGSAIGGEIVKDWIRNKAPTPIEVNRDYTLPNYADSRSLVVISSYSGDTEESLSAFLDAKRRGCMTCCISSGGLLLQYAEKFGVPFLNVPKGMPPRAALPYMFIPLLRWFERVGFVSGFSKELEEAKGVLEKVAKNNSPGTPVKKNPAKSLAAGIFETVTVVYGFGLYRSVAQRFKQQFNENSKVPAKWEFLPELDHNEIVGWEENGSLTKHFSAIFFRGKNETDEVRNRIEITKKLMAKAVSKQFEVWSQGKNDLAMMLSTILLGDFTSVYLAILRKVDPTPVQMITLLKKELGTAGTKARLIGELEKLALA
jgi:glucose/mannose-6-phosphate isomerase